MTVWVDADSCPRAVRDIISRAAERVRCKAVFVANRPVPGSDAGGSHFVRVEQGQDVADRYIESHASAGDLVVTRDIPFASRLVELGARVINDRGDVYSKENVRERLSVRDFMHDLRDYGMRTPPGPPFGLRHRHAFANALDRELAKMIRPNAGNADPSC